MSIQLKDSAVTALLLITLSGCSGSVESDDRGGGVEAQTAALSQADVPDVPAALAVPEGNRLAFLLDAIGQQIYGCQPTATGYGWGLIAPDADLFKPNGHVAGSHYAGPTWEALDGSTVVGARVAAYSADPTAIPWLLLSAASHAGHGKMSKVSFIHRLDTTAGLAPTTGCDADHVGAQSSIDYTATYYFYEPKPSCSH
jgi:hypothetical protein